MKWWNNMAEKSEPEIEASDGSQFTKIIFKPDLTRFRMKTISEDM